MRSRRCQRSASTPQTSFSRVIVEAEKPRHGAPQERRQGFPEVAGGNALQIQPWQKVFQALGAAQIARQDRRREADGAVPPVPHTGLAHAHRADPGLDEAFRQISIAAMARMSSRSCSRNQTGARQSRPSIRTAMATALSDMKLSESQITNLLAGTLTRTERDRLPRRPRESAAATGSRPCWQGGGFGELAGAARRQPACSSGRST